MRIIVEIDINDNKDRFKGGAQLFSKVNEIEDIESASNRILNLALKNGITGELPTTAFVKFEENGKYIPPSYSFKITKGDSGPIITPN